MASDRPAAPRRSSNTNIEVQSDNPIVLAGLELKGVHDEKTIRVRVLESDHEAVIREADFNEELHEKIAAKKKRQAVKDDDDDDDDDDEDEDLPSPKRTRRRR